MSAARRSVPAPNAAALATPLAVLQLCKRTQKACRALQIETVGQFLARPRADFLAIRGCGPRTYSELVERNAWFAGEFGGAA